MPNGSPLDVIVLRRVFLRAVDDEVRLLGIAEREARDLLRRVDVRFDQRRRDAERAGDVVEAGRRVVGRQVLGRVDLEVRAGRERRSRTRCGSGGAGPAAAQTAMRRAIELVLERGDVRLEDRRLRPPRPGGRHLSRAHLAHDQLPRLPVPVDVGDVERVDFQLARFVTPGGRHALVVARRAVLREERPQLVES